LNEEQKSQSGAAAPEASEGRASPATGGVPQAHSKKKNFKLLK
jgi:hypothetical protein